MSVARVRNANLNVTGALIATAGAFAQCLEGPRASIDKLMISIDRDPAHTELRVILDQAVVGRRFPHWALAYCGKGGAINDLVDPLRMVTDETDETTAVRHDTHHAGIRGGLTCAAIAREM